MENLERQKPDNKQNPKDEAYWKNDVRRTADCTLQIRDLYHDPKLGYAHTWSQDHYHETETSWCSDKEPQWITAPAEWVPDPEVQRKDPWAELWTDKEGIR